MSDIDFDAGNNEVEKYEIEVIWDSAAYAKKLESGQLSKFYYLVSGKGYPEEENIQKLYSKMQHLRNFNNLFHKEHLDKLTAIFKTIDTAPQIARPKISPNIETIKQK